MKRLLIIYGCLFGWAFTGVDLSAAPLLFVSLLEKKQIVAFERNVTTGELVRRAVTNCPAEPAGMAVSADGRVLYVSLRSTGQLAAYLIGFDDGRLELINVVDAGDDPAFMLPDKSGQFLLSAYYLSDKVCVHRLEKNGAISSQPLQTVLTADKAHGIAFDSQQRFAFVTHTGANRIYQFQFDSASGQLSPSQPPFVATPPADHPRHIVMHPSDRWAYTSNEAGDSISLYEVASDTGTLRRLQTLPTIPADVDGNLNSTARCEMTPDGRFVFVANRGHDSLAGFAIDQRTGRLTALGQTATEPVPRSFTFSSDGHFLYAAGQASGRLAAFRVLADGRLQRFATYESGPISWWAVAVDDPN